MLHDEYLPSVTVPADVDLDAYVAQLFERWSNTALGHRTQQVGSDGSVKLGQRVPEPALLQLRRGRMPHHLALTVAAYLCCLAPPAGFDPGPHADAMVDPARAGLVGDAAPQPFAARSSPRPCSTTACSGATSPPTARSPRASPSWST